MIDQWKTWTREDSPFTKMGAGKSDENTPNALNLSAQKFGFSMEKGFIGRP